MNRIRIAWVGAALLAAGGAVAIAEEPKPARPVSAEPPLELVVEVEGKKVDALLDTPFQVEVGGKRVSMRVQRKPERTFVAHGLTFRYPVDMGFEYDGSDPEATQWTFDGNDSVMIVTRHVSTDDPEELLKEVLGVAVGRYGKGARVKDAAVRLGGVEQAAPRIDVTIAGARLRQDILVLAHGDARWILILQDSLSDDGAARPESERVRALLDASWSLSK